MKGVDPSTHEVLPELERVRDYYTKIRNIEEPDIETREIFPFSCSTCSYSLH